jgi:hypothetical protein
MFLPKDGRLMAGFSRDISAGQLQHLATLSNVFIACLYLVSAASAIAPGLQEWCGLTGVWSGHIYTQACQTSSSCTVCLIKSTAAQFDGKQAFSSFVKLLSSAFFEQTVDQWWSASESIYGACNIPGPSTAYPYGTSYYDTCGGSTYIATRPLQDASGNEWGRL